MTLRLSRLRRLPRVFLLLVILVSVGSPPTLAADWSQPAQQLARKVSAKSGPVAVAISFKNISSLSGSDMSDARRALEQALRAAGLRFVPAGQGIALLRVTFSENVAGYLWIAELHRSAGQETVPEDPKDEVAMIAVPKMAAGEAPRVAASVTIRKQMLWLQAEPILDAAVLDAGGPAPRLLVLAPERVTIYRKDAARWEVEQALPITHARPWPRDLRGRLMPRQNADRLFDVFLPGMMCSSSAKPPLTLTCRAGDDPWPLAVAGQPPQYAAYSAQRDLFTGALRPGFGETRSTTAFYTAAGLPRANYTLWLFAGIDGALRITDGASERVIGPRGWGSDVAVVMNGCGGPQAVITAAGDSNAADTVVVLDVPEREPIVVSQPLEFSGPVTALWSAADGSTALAVSKNLKAGQYEAYTLTLACGQ